MCSFILMKTGVFRFGEKCWRQTMSPIVDETAGDHPVRDVGLTRGGLMPTVPGLYANVSFAYGGVFLNYFIGI